MWGGCSHVTLAGCAPAACSAACCTRARPDRWLVHSHLLRRTLIRSFEREMYVIPNAVFSKNTVLNVTRKSREWRFYEYLCVRVQDVHKVNAIIQVGAGPGVGSTQSSARDGRTRGLTDPERLRLQRGVLTIAWCGGAAVLRAGCCCWLSDCRKPI